MTGVLDHQHHDERDAADHQDVVLCLHWQFKILRCPEDTPQMHVAFLPERVHVHPVVLCATPSPTPDKALHSLKQKKTLNVVS